MSSEREPVPPKNETEDEESHFDTRSQGIGFYHWPALWLASVPETSGDRDIPTKDSLFEIVHQADLGCGLRIEAARNGLFVYWVQSLPWAMSPSDAERGTADPFRHGQQRVRLINLHLCCLYTAVGLVDKTAIAKAVCTPNEMVALSEPGSTTFMYSGSPLAVALSGQVPPYVRDYPAGAVARNQRGVMDYVISSDALTLASQLLDEALRRDDFEDALWLGELLLRATRAYEDSNYPAALVTSWAITERELNAMWRSYLNAHRTAADGSGDTLINGDRLKKLTGMDYSASVVTEMVTLLGLIDLGTYKTMERVRKVRNKWAHELQEVDAEEARSALHLAEDMIMRTKALPLRLTGIGPFGSFG